MVNNYMSDSSVQRIYMCDNLPWYRCAYIVFLMIVLVLVVIANDDNNNNNNVFFYITFPTSSFHF